MSTIWIFHDIKNNHILYREKDFMKRFCKSKGEQAKNITDFKKKKMIFLTKEELKSHQGGKYVISVENKS